MQKVNAATDITTEFVHLPPRRRFVGQADVAARLPAEVNAGSEAMTSSQLGRWW